MVQKKPYYITTAIAYTSGKPHIGNTYEIVLTDAIARFKRNQGYDVRFQTGTDEHGQKIEEKAAAAGVTPKQFVDGVAQQIKEIWDLMNVSYDKFIRTTDTDQSSKNCTSRATSTKARTRECTAPPANRSGHPRSSKTENAPTAAAK